MGWER